MKNILLLVFLEATIVVVGWGWCSSTRGDIVILNPILDTSIYSENNNSNASGDLFAGRNRLGNVRRALLEFNLSSIPSGSTINSVSLDLIQTKHGAASTAESFDLHRVLKTWGEGTSTGTGQGGPPTAGDATWNFSQFSTNTPISWTLPGGDFTATSGTASIGITDNIAYTFGSQPGLVTDVQNWVNSPASNFGWILKAKDETINQDARIFGSRESVANTPRLTVNFTAVPEPGSYLLLGSAALVAFAYRSRRQSFRRAARNET